MCEAVSVSDLTIHDLVDAALVTQLWRVAMGTGKMPYITTPYNPNSFDLRTKLAISVIDPDAYREMYGEEAPP